MADNLIFPIGFDLEKGVKDVISRSDTYLRQIEHAMNRKPIVLRAEVDASKFQMFSRQFTNSIDGISAKLAQAQRLWNAMTFDVKFDADGNLSRRAQVVFDAFQQLTQASVTMGQRLGEVNRNLAKSEQDTARAITAEYDKRRQQVNEQIRLKERQAAAEERVRQGQLKGVNVGYVETQRQVEAVRNLRLQYEAILPMLNAMAQRRYDIKVGIDKQFEADIQRINAEIARLRQSNLQLGAKGDTNAIQANLQAIRQLEAELQRIGQQKIDLLNSNKINSDLARLRTEISSVFGELQSAERRLASDNSLNAALDAQSQKVLKLHADIQKLDQQFAQLNATGRAYNQDGSFTAQANSLLQQRIALTKQLEQEAITGQQAQIKLEQQLREEKRQTEQAAKNAAKEAERQAKAEAAARKQAQDAANAENKARQEAYNARRRQGQETQRILNKEAKSIADITAKLQIQQQRLQSANIGSAKFNKIAEEVRRLTADLEKANQKMRELTGQTQSGAARQSAAVKQVSQEFKHQDGYVSRLLKRLAVYASFSYAAQFLTSIREVTAQFELQRVSLGAIIQDQNKANQLFSEIKSFALKSPVSILDLTKYTKQLAAYKIGYDELFETTKKLTDVSVGLGVSMDRVVLAYGQVRATGYLRASEIRQFTEMGVPIVEELASKLSKMNGELVTAAQVMDLVSKRGISFEMVKEVFDDMTSAGGIFYNMQEKQGNTLYGLWAKLGDAASVMYSEIGNTGPINDGMKSLISGLTSLMKNWRLVAGEAMVAVASFGAYKAIQALTVVSTEASTKATQRLMAAKNALTAAQNRLTAAQRLGNNAAIRHANLAVLEAQWTVKAAAANRLAANATNVWTAAKYRLIAATSQLKAAMAGNWIMLTVAAVAAIAVAIGGAIEKATRLKRALDDIEASTVSLQNQSVGRFEHLAEAAVNAADGSKRQRDALAELSRTYGDILPQDALKLENLKRLNHNYTELTTSLKEYIAVQQKNKGMEEISSEYGGKINEASKKAIDSLVEYAGVERDVAINIVGEMQRDIQEKLEKGERDFRTTGQKFQAAAAKFGVHISNSLAGSITTSSWYDNWYDHIGLGKATNEFQALTEAVAGQYNELDEWNKRVDASTGATGAWSKELEAAKKKIDELSLTNPDGSPIDNSTFQGSQIKANETMKVVADLINNDTQIKDAIKKKEVEWNQDWIHLVGSVDKNNLMDITTVNFDAIIEALNKKHPELADKIRDIQQEWGNVAPTNATAVQIKYKTGQIADAFKVSMDKMQKYLWDGSGSVDDYLKRLKDQQAELNARLKEKQQQLVNMGVLSKWWNKLLGKDIEAEVEQMKKEIKALDTLVPFVTGYTVPGKNKNKGRKSDTRLQVLQEVAQTLATINKEYDDLAKKEGASKALADIKERFKEVLAYTNKIGGKFGLNFDFPTEFKTLQEYRNAILKVMQSLKGLPKGSEKTILDFKTMIGKADSDYLQKQIEKQLKELSDRISHTKTAKEFYEKILRLTRNEDLAFRATFSVFGQDKLDTFNDEVEQLKQNFGEIDITAAINLNTKQIDYKALREIWETDKALPDNLRKIPQAYDSAIKSILDAGDKLSERQLERWGKDLERAREYADKRIELAQYTATQIAEIEAKRDSLDPESKNYAAQVAMYDKMISGYREREKNEAAKLDYEQIKEQIGMFDDLGVRIGTAFESILNGLREYTQSPDFARLGLEAQKNVYQQIAKIEDRMAEGFQGIGVGTVSEYVRQYSTAASEYLTAQNNLRDATLRAIEADKEWERVKNSNDEAAKSAALAERTLADSRVRTAAASVNAAGANMQRAQEGAARASAKFDSNLQKVESSLKSLNNGALKALWDLIGDKGKRSVGEFLSGSRKILSALDKLTKALADSGSDMGQLSTTIATNLAAALQNINPDDTEAIARVATESLKTTLSSVISDKGVVDLLANTLSKNIGEIASQALSGVLSTEDAANKVGALIDGVADAASKTGEMWGAIISLVLSLLDEFAENGIGTFLGELLDNIADAVEGILANLLTDSLPKILGSVGNVIKGVGTGLGDLLTFGVFDLTGAKRIKKANKEIKRQQQLLEQLEYTYGRLEKAAEKLFGSDYIDNYNQRLKDLQAQQEAYLKQAEAEKSKGKKEDEEKTKEYLDKARDTADQIADMQEDLIEHFTGSSRADIARQMAKSWIDARASMSDTFAAIKGDYADMIKNMLVEGAAARVIENALTPVWDSMQKMLDKNDVQGAIDSLVNGMDSALNAANNGMEVLWKALEARGYDMKQLIGDTDSEYTGIAKSVAGATSEEINNVAAIGNTLMYYVSPIPRMDENLARVVALMEGRGAALPTASGATTGAVDYTEMFTTANQHLSSLPRMEQHLAEIHTMLGRALKTKGSTTGFNTFLNS